MYEIYEENESVIRRESDGAFIPLDEGNIDYQEFKKWKGKGNTPKIKKKEKNPVPFAISRFQALAALYQSGKLNAIETYMAAETTPFLTKLAWKEAVVFYRNSPLINALKGEFNLKDEDLDDLFILADGILV